MFFYKFVKIYGLHLILFVVTVGTTMLAGSELITNKSWANWFNGSNQLAQPRWVDFLMGGMYSFAFLSFLTFHEFGHFFMAKYHKVKTSLPYYIPIFIPFFPINIGTFGAVIRLKEMPDSKIKFYDIGIAGPLAGFVVSIILLIVGFSTLPELDYLYTMNPQYLEDFGRIPTEDQLLSKYAMYQPLPRIGDSILFSFIKTTFADPTRLPNHFDLIHYPLIFVGFITLFFTALNLLPIGQLDGGHLTYGLFGSIASGLISRLAVLCLVVYGGIGLIHYDPNTFEWVYFLLGYIAYLIFISKKLVGEFSVVSTLLLIAGTLLLQQGLQHLFLDIQPNLLWLFYALLSVTVIGLDHPITNNEAPLDFKRKVLGWICIIVFILCFTPQPLVFEFADIKTGTISLLP